MLTTDIASYECCPSIMHNCHSITAWCVLVILSFCDTCFTCYRSMHYATMRYCIVWVHHGNHRYGDHRYHSLWQPERLTLTSVCSEMISYMLSCNYYSHMMLSIYDSCSPCYRSMLNATMRYCIVWGPSIWESSIWGPLIWGPSVYVDINITISVDIFSCAW
jgi:hypothetical protein